MIEIKESTYDDIKNIQKLWVDADVMNISGQADYTKLKKA